MKSRASPRLTFTLLLLAWLAQLCLPAVHASMMAAPQAGKLGWCGDPTRFRALVAALPAELREAMDPDGARHDRQELACALLCAAGTTPAPVSAAPPVPISLGVFSEAMPALHASPLIREQAPRPPAQGPPLIV